MDALLVSTAIVALAEIGDKTQLLAFILAAKFRRPWPIVLGILVATLANHAFAAAVGTWLTTLMGPQTLRWVLGLSFIAMAVWTLIPDKLDEDEARLPRLGVFGATLVAFDPASGEVLGVMNMVFVKSTKENVLSDPSGISYAIPVEYLQRLLADLK